MSVEEKMICDEDIMWVYDGEKVEKCPKEKEFNFSQPVLLPDLTKKLSEMCLKVARGFWRAVSFLSDLIDCTCRILGMVLPKFPLRSGGLVDSLLFAEHGFVLQSDPATILGELSESWDSGSLAQLCKKVCNDSKSDRIIHVTEGRGGAPTRDLYEISFLKYKFTPKEERSSMHSGQRKLILAEIEFLTQYFCEGLTVVYAGSSPGYHIELLAKMFSSMHFVLYDPRPYKGGMVDNVTVYRREFRPELVDDTVPMLFISDIRTFDSTDCDDLEAEIKADMTRQMTWHLQLEPIASMLKFRLPWVDKGQKFSMTEYLKGKVMLPVFGRQTTTETRLIVQGSEFEFYDNLDYEGRCHNFNLNIRRKAYDDEFGSEFCHCYDCTVERLIVTTYLKEARVELTYCELEQLLDYYCSQSGKPIWAKKDRLAKKSLRSSASRKGKRRKRSKHRRTRVWRTKR